MCCFHMGIARKEGGVQRLARMIWGTFLHVCPFDRGGFPQPLPEAQSAEAFDNQGTGTGTRTEGGGQFLFLFPSLFFNYSQPCFCVSTFEECQQSAANQNA